MNTSHSNPSHGVGDSAFAPAVVIEPDGTPFVTGCPSAAILGHRLGLPVYLKNTLTFWWHTQGRKSLRRTAE